MPGQYSGLIPHLRGSFLSRNDMQAWLRAITDEFAGSGIDGGRWTTCAANLGSQASIATDSPTRIIMNTNSNLSAVTLLREGGSYKWNASDKVSIIVRAKRTSACIGDIAVNANNPSTNLFFFPIYLSTTESLTPTCKIYLGYQTDTTKTCMILVSDDGLGSASINTIGEPDTAWHDYSMVITNGSIKARIDCDPTPYAINTSNITNRDLELRCGIQGLTAGSHQIDIDFITIIPSLQLF